MGSKHGVGPVLKVMVDDTDDPLTTSNDDHEKFMFNSEVQKLGYLYDVRGVKYDSVKYPTTGGFYEPPGTNISNATEYISSQPSPGFGLPALCSQWVIPSRMGFSYSPIVEVRLRDYSTNIHGGPSAAYTRTQNAGGGGEVGYIEGSPGYQSLMVASFTFAWGTSPGQFSTVTAPAVPIPQLTSALSGGIVRLLSTIELPGLDEAIPDYTTTRIAGTREVHISPTRARMAYAGRDTEDPDPRHFIFHEGRVPAKLIACGEVTINASSNVLVTTVLPPSQHVYVDFIARRTTDSLCHPPYLPGGLAQSYRILMQYKIEATGVRLYNASANNDIVVRYMIYGDDDSANTTGGTAVLRGANDGTQDYLQIKVPGSSDSAPNFNDILVDSRLPYVPIIDEGYLPHTAFVEATDNSLLGLTRKTINFTNNGFLPFVKYTAVYSSDLYQQPRNRILRVFGGVSPAGWNTAPAGMSVNCVINTSNVRFYMSRGNPHTLSINGFNVATPNYGTDPIGIRYYIFAIPTSL